MRDMFQPRQVAAYTDTGSSLFVDVRQLQERFGMAAKAHLDLGSVGAKADGSCAKTVDQFLADRGRLPSDFRGRLELASATEVGLMWKYSGSTYTNPAQNLFVLVES